MTVFEHGFTPGAENLGISAFPQVSVNAIAGAARGSLDYDDTTKEYAYFDFVVHEDYAGGTITVKVWSYSKTATTGNVIYGAALMAVSDGDSQDLEADGFDSETLSAATTIAGTAKYPDVVTISITTNKDSMAAGDLVTLELSRDSTNVSDTVTGDM